MSGRVFAFGLGVLLIVSLVSAQEPGTPPGGTPGGRPGGLRPPEFPQPGQVLSSSIQDQLKLTAEQKEQLAEFQKEVDARLAKVLTAEQKKSLQDIRSGKGAAPKGFGPPVGFGPGTRTDDVKKQIGATDEEWKVIGPKLQKVITARQRLNSEGGFGGASIVTQAQGELKSALADSKLTKAEVEEKIAAVRKARQTMRADLDAAQKDLLQLVTASQEVVLISLGHLE